jgi:tetratricopeptide (TPR) repeat protein
LKTAGLWELLQQIVTSGIRITIPPNTSPENQRLLQAVSAWRAGRDAFSGGQLENAVQRFEEAARLIPSGKIYAMDAVLALASLGDWQEVNAGLARIWPDWRDDIRFPVAAAMLGMAHGDLEQAERWLRNPAESATIQPEQAMIADEYFYVLLWQNKIAQAEQFAQQMTERDRTPDARKSVWIERLGDTAFMSGDFGAALRRYEESLDISTDHPETRVLLKLSDVYFRLGDLSKERHYRQLIYGRLEQ